MNDRNLYAPPKAAITEVKAAKCAREGKSVVVQVGSDLPPRCIVCNAPALQPVKAKKVYWHSPWLYVLVLINILVYLVVALLARKSFEVSAGLCAQHTTARKRRVWGLLGVGVAAVVLAGFTLAAEEGTLAIVLFLVALGTLVGAAIAGRRVYPKKITKTYAKLGGCKEPFLASLE